MIGLLVTFALLSIMMVLAMVPLTIELIGASGGMPQHRRRLRGLGGVGVLTERLLPRALDQHSPRQVWGVVYGLCWTGLLVVGGVLIFTSEPQQRVHNLLVVTVVAAGWGCVHAAVVWLGRALNRTNEPARRRTSAAAEPADEACGATHPSASDSDVETESIRTEAATAEIAARAPAGKTRSAVTLALILLVALLLIGIGDVLAEQSQTLQSVDRLLNAHYGLLLGLTIALAALGCVIFMGAILNLILSRGQPMSREEIEAMRARVLVTRHTVAARAGSYKLAGEAVGAQVQDEWSLGQMKQAWRSRAWRHSRIWKRRFIVCIGAVMLLLGLFGLFIVIGSWGVRLLIGVALVYATTRAAWAVYRVP